MKRIFVINGSADENSSNKKLIDNIVLESKDLFSISIFSELKSLPHFDPALSIDNTPEIISDLRTKIESADGIIICTPEYVFSIPSGLKNAIEWCVSTTVFSDKPTGLITASASGEKAHEELKLIMTTLMAKTSNDAFLLIKGVKGKINDQGTITDSETIKGLTGFITAFNGLVTGEN